MVRVGRYILIQFLILLCFFGMFYVFIITDAVIIDA